MPSATALRVAVVGAGIAGSRCAHALTRAGCQVHIVDKSRGPGGRLATRRLGWTDPQGQPRLERLDHGAPAFSARDPGFRAFLADQGTAAAPWTPRWAPGGRALHEPPPYTVWQPEMPALCRGLLEGVTATWSLAVDRLEPEAQGWRLEAAGQALPGHFDAVVLAVPPAQAAPLLAPHRPDWAQRAATVPMRPCWTLMGVSRRPAVMPEWDAARPAGGVLAWLVRNDAKPGRAAAPGEAHWVAHARSGWSQQHLEQAADAVQARLQEAVQVVLGQPLDWLHAVVHRWRYALPPALPEPKADADGVAASAEPAWWDAASGLGVCGDFLGGAEVEGAWRSAEALVARLRGSALR